MDQEFVRELKDQAIFRLRENPPRIRICVEQLSEEAIWHKPNDVSNSVGNLIVHLCGNITQYILASLAGQPDHRDRDSEFNQTGGLTGEQLLAKIEQVTEDAVAVIDTLDPTEMIRERQVQGFSMTGIGIILHVAEHFSYHTGQIAVQTKLLNNQDLGFYANLDLNIHNE